MAIISLEEGDLRTIARRRQGNPRFSEILERTGLASIPLSNANITPEIKKLLEWAHWEQRLFQLSKLLPFLLCAIYYAFMVPQLHFFALAAIATALLPFCLYGFYVNSPLIAERKLDALLQTPYLLLHDGNIYENFPSLRSLDWEIHSLEETKLASEQSIQRIDRLIKEMKEQLILLGQDTNDQYLIDLETQKINQRGLIEKANTLLKISSTSKQEQVDLQQNILAWAELELLRQEAASIAGTSPKSQSWEKMTELELRAAELAFQLHDVNSELQELLYRQKTAALEEQG